MYAVVDAPERLDHVLNALLDGRFERDVDLDRLCSKSRVRGGSGRFRDCVPGSLEIQVRDQEATDALLGE